MNIFNSNMYDIILLGRYFNDYYKQKFQFFISEVICHQGGLTVCLPTPNMTAHEAQWLE